MNRRIIRNKHDVQSMIMGLIFRQDSPYETRDIVYKALSEMKGSPYRMGERELTEMIEKNLRSMLESGRINEKDGYYIPIFNSNITNDSY